METKIATSADEAVKQIDKFKPGVILLDFQLGTQNALVLLNELQSYSDSREIPVVILATDAKRLKLTDLAQYNIKAILDKATTTPEEITKWLTV